jgi:hypothetical protein
MLRGEMPRALSGNLPDRDFHSRPFGVRNSRPVFYRRQMNGTHALALAEVIFILTVIFSTLRKR